MENTLYLAAYLWIGGVFFGMCCMHLYTEAGVDEWPEIIFAVGAAAVLSSLWIAVIPVGFVWIKVSDYFWQRRMKRCVRSGR